MISRAIAAVRPYLFRSTVAVLALALMLAFPHGPLLAAQDQGTAPVVETAQAAPAPADASAGGLTDLQQIGYGCIIGTAVFMTLTAAAGATEVVQIFAGGALVPTSAMVLWVSLSMGAAAQTCTATGLATPALVHAWDNLTSLYRGASASH